MKLILIILCLSVMILPVSGLEFEAPAVPDSAQDLMPEHSESFAEGFPELLTKTIMKLSPDLHVAAKTSLEVFGILLLITVVQTITVHTKYITDVAGAVAVASLLLVNTNSMLYLASDAFYQITDYGKLLLPVMTAALAAQGGVTTSAALYTGTAAFTAILQSIMSGILLPGIYILLALRTGNCITGEDLLKRMGDILKGFLSWCLKILLMIFTTYISMTGVISGTADAASVKAAKVAFSTFVPVVGSALSDAAESVLISVNLMKNAAGVYGILAVLAVFLHPFLQIAVQYIMLKLTAGICASFSVSRVSGVIDAFCSAMGFMLAMTAAACVMVLISTICFMRGIT